MASGAGGADHSRELARRASVVDDSEAHLQRPPSSAWWETGRACYPWEQFRGAHQSHASFSETEGWSSRGGAVHQEVRREQVHQDTPVASTYTDQPAVDQTLLHVNSSGRLARTGSGTLTWTLIGGVTTVDEGNFGSGAEQPLAGWPSHAAEQSFTSPGLRCEVHRNASSFSHAPQAFDPTHLLESRRSLSASAGPSGAVAAAQDFAYRASPPEAPPLRHDPALCFDDLAAEISALPEAGPVVSGVNVVGSKPVSSLQAPGLAAGYSGIGGALRLEPQRCQIQSCQAELTHSKPYCRRYKLCEGCIRSDSVLVRGVEMRFCQQCRYHGCACYAHSCS